MVVAVVCKPDGNGGVWRILAHDDHTGELLHRETHGQGSRTIIGLVEIYRLRAYLAAEGIGENGWAPE